MRIGAFIPIKSRNERVPGKNLRAFRGQPLYEWIILHALDAGCFSTVVVDTDHPQIAAFTESVGAIYHERLPRLAEGDANGNDLLKHHRAEYPDFDLYFQLFATAPTLDPASIRSCVDVLAHASQHDSILTAVRAPGWHWFEGQPVNYRPGVLPRSQDAPTLYRETTGLYGIKAAALDRYGCRVGACPRFHEVTPDEAIDLDTEADFAAANNVAAVASPSP